MHTRLFVLIQPTIIIDTVHILFGSIKFYNVSHTKYLHDQRLNMQYYTDGDYMKEKQVELYHFYVVILTT